MPGSASTRVVGEGGPEGRENRNGALVGLLELGVVRDKTGDVEVSARRARRRGGNHGGSDAVGGQSTKPRHEFVM